MQGYALSRLLQLASPMLPVGAYSYSQGLEAAIDLGWVHNAETAAEWLSDVMATSQGSFEWPLLARMMLAWQATDPAMAGYWNDFLLSGRETAEARAETLQMGYSLSKLLDQWLGSNPLHAFSQPTFPLAYACVSVAWRIPSQAALHAYGWSWLENQISVLMKTLPLGQMAAQRLLMQLSDVLDGTIETALNLPDQDLNNFAPGLALAGSYHETQYSRLFRS